MKFFKVIAFFVVAITSLEATTYVVTSTNNPGQGSLYEALQSANAHAGADTITFDIVNSDPPYSIIYSGIKLPYLTDNGTFINGYSQEGSKPSTGLFGEPDNASILLLMDGVLTDSQYAPLTITSDSNEICGLILSRVKGFDVNSGGCGIMIDGGSYNHIWGCWLGLDTLGTSDWGSNQAGIVLRNKASGNLIGGTTPAERNVISGNNTAQIAILDNASDDNMIVGNLIGTDKTGASKPLSLSSSGSGILIQGIASGGPQRTMIGGADSLSANVIAANPQDGILVSGPIAHSGWIMNNRIGVTAAGAALGNAGSGIQLTKGASGDSILDNWIAYHSLSGILASDTNTNGHVILGNKITNNKSHGISLYGLVQNCRVENCEISNNTGAGIFAAGPGTDFNTITRNSIFDNGGLGIDLAPEGVNLNDGSDIDNGANEQMNYPIFDSVSTTRAYGHIEGYSRKGATVEVFAASVDPSGNGEGKTFLGTGTSDKEGKFEIVMTHTDIGSYITSVAIDTAGNTSEFSKNAYILKEGPGVAEIPKSNGAFLMIEASGRSLGISYYIPEPTDLRLALFDASGTLVREDYHETQRQGLHKLLWNTSGMASGVYFVRLETRDKVLMGRAVLIH